MEEKIFHNVNGNTYYILFGRKGGSAFLCNLNANNYVICVILEENSWWHGCYFEDFETAYEYWKRN